MKTLSGRRNLSVLALVREGDVLPTLKLLKRYGGGFAPVVFDKASQDVLALTLTGGERISW